MRGREFKLDVYPKIPKKLARLEELANNLWYSWDRPTRALFGPLNASLWESVDHNPKLFLQRIDEHILEEASRDQVFLSNYNKVLSAYDTYHQDTERYQSASLLGDDDLVAYFCAEYGLHESLHIYSGGLGILAGHHCKTASDLRLPFVAVGLMYRAGYFSQQIDGEGRQVATYVESEIESLPINPAYDANGKEIFVEVPLAGGKVRLQVWQVRVGHVMLYLLDAAVDGNSAEDREITHQLYGGDREMRIKQEIVLGVGGVRALRSLGIAPTVWHCNEGHPAFSILERIREQIASGLDFASALEAVAASTVFTTHTPVPAGHDHFSEDLTLRYLAPMLTELGITGEKLMSLGRLDGDGSDFNMTTFAITGSRHSNGVSRLHGQVSANICGKCWPQVPASENPMDYITNGVHVTTALAQDWFEVFDRFLGVEWRNHLCDYDYWQRVREIPDHLFWSVSQSIKSKTLNAVREALLHQHLRNQVSEPHLERILRHIDPSDPNVLTIGFARRFATYKRGTMLFNRLDWLREVVADEDKPVVFIFAGKAHPADQPGQHLLQRVHEVSQMTEFVGKVLLVENYDLALARRLVAGVDVWLNNPVYAMEASGTSGMKAAINGTINLSVTDGWWAEGFEGDNGWAIKPSPHGEDEARRDAEDARTLYEILQDDVAPLYYRRGKYGYSPQWVHMAKRSMASVLPRFNMNRVVNEYTAKFYSQAATKGRQLEHNEFEGARTLARWKERVKKAWPGVALRRIDEPVARLTYGQGMRIEVAAALNGLAPEDVVLELLVERTSGGGAAGVRGDDFPRVTALDELRADEGALTACARLSPVERLGNSGEHLYRLELEPEWCGRLLYRVRCYPYHHLLTHALDTGLMVWL